MSECRAGGHGKEHASGMLRTHGGILALLAAVAVLAYLPVLWQPLLEDDYPNIEQARVFGEQGWSHVFTHTVFRYRATFWPLAWSLDRLFGPWPAALYGTNIALHVFCTWVVYALGIWRVIGWRTSAVAAGFFAVYEGHQEAVMWYSAGCELLMFLFGVASLVLWIVFLERHRGRLWYAASLACFALALLSKESAVMFAALLLLPLWGSRVARRALVWWIPYALMSGVIAALILAGRGNSFRFADGSFSLTAPFWITLPVSCVRLLWPWGIMAVLAILLLRAKRQVVAIAATWIVLAFLPYSFLTYMHRIPSRQTYVASLGLALLVSAGFWALHARLRLHRPAIVATLAAAVLVANTGYLWTKKREQYLRRAAPTQALIALARKTDGPIYMRCYPGPPIIYDAAVQVEARRPASILIWEPARASKAVAEFCWQPR